MSVTSRTAKPKFAPYQTWGSCSRCGARVAYNTLRRERLTGLLMCSSSSGRPVSPCWDPWPKVYDFQAYPDKSIEPPPEPLPARWNLDAIWGSGSNPAPAPDDATRLAKLLTSVPYYATQGQSAAFPPMPAAKYQIADVTSFNTADYDGTFMPSGSVRTVVPPPASVDSVSKTDVDIAEQLFGPPASVVKGV